MFQDVLARVHAATIALLRKLLPRRERFREVFHKPSQHAFRSRILDSCGYFRSAAFACVPGASDGSRNR
jgi:hypothetical protein